MQGIALNVSTERFKNEYPDGCPVRGYKDGETVKQYSILMLRRYIHGVLTYRPTWRLQTTRLE